MTPYQALRNALFTLLFLYLCRGAEVLAANLTIQWSAPTQNTDNSPFNNPAFYKIAYGDTLGRYTNTLSTPNALTSARITALLPGKTYYFVISVVSVTGIESPVSEVKSYTTRAAIVDSDLDGIPDSSDNCPAISNATQLNTDRDSLGDACDPDDDNDGTLDTQDCAPLDSTRYRNAPLFPDPDLDGVRNSATGQATCYGAVPPSGFTTNTTPTLDNCLAAANSDQLNFDGDALGNVCDPDDDNDGVSDAQDCSPLDSTRYRVGTFYADSDGDGVRDNTTAQPICYGATPPAGVTLSTIPNLDNCAGTANANQSNFDGDAGGDACDLDDDNDGTPDAQDCAPLDATRFRSGTFYSDSDSDGVRNSTTSQILCYGVSPPAALTLNTAPLLDNCPAVANTNQLNSDTDAIGDACDTDDDNDGTLDALDCAPLDTTKYRLANAYIDSDLDGVRNSATAQQICYGATLPSGMTLNTTGSVDNCPGIANLNQLNSDNDAVGDACDTDDDNDATLDINDCAPLDPTRYRTAVLYADPDRDGVRNVTTGSSTCYGVLPVGLTAATVPNLDNCGTTANPDQTDSDGDTVGNACDLDDDNDGTPDTADCAPFDNRSYRNVVVYPDGDDDGIRDTTTGQSLCSGTTLPAKTTATINGPDNCVQRANADQTDANKNGIGDLCETDLDLDGVRDVVDNCPLVANPLQEDLDGDAFGDLCDQDSDGDTIIDTDDCAPKDRSAYRVVTIYTESDGDGFVESITESSQCIGLEVPAGKSITVTSLDNCPLLANADQLDSDQDGVGDACQSAAPTPTPIEPTVRGVPLDFDGDKKADGGVVVSDTKRRKLRHELTEKDGTVSSAYFGRMSDTPAYGDYDGDLIADLAVMRGNKRTLAWLVKSSAYGVTNSFTLSQPVDFALSGCMLDSDSTTVDIAGVSEKKRLYIYRRSSDGSTVTLPLAIPSGAEILDLQCADIDGDQSDELIVLYQIAKNKKRAPKQLQASAVKTATSTEKDRYLQVASSKTGLKIAEVSLSYKKFNKLFVEYQQNRVNPRLGVYEHAANSKRSRLQLFTIGGAADSRSLTPLAPIRIGKQVADIAPQPWSASTPTIASSQNNPLLILTSTNEILRLNTESGALTKERATTKTLTSSGIVKVKNTASKNTGLTNWRFMRVVNVKAFVKH